MFQIAPNEHVPDYRKNGFAIVRNLLPREEIESLRSEMAKLAHDKDVDALELLSYDALQYIILDDRILTIARQALGDKIVYFGDSTFYTANRFSRHLHNDARNDFDDMRATDYPMLRMGIYLQDHAEHGDGLKVGIGSHRRALWLPNNFKRVLGLGRGARLPARALLPARLHNVTTRPGDLVYWNLRTHHAGHAVRLKVAPWLALHPKIENLLPPSVGISQEKPRYAMFFSFAAPGPALDRYLEHMRGNPHRQRVRNTGGFRGAAIQAKALEKGLIIRDDWAD